MPRTLKSTTELVGFLNRGRFLELANGKLQEALETLAEAPDEKGVATVTIAIKITRLNERYDIAPVATSKLPTEKPFPSTSFWLVDGELSLEHPNQADMFDRPRAADRRETA